MPRQTWSLMMSTSLTISTPWGKAVPSQSVLGNRWMILPHPSPESAGKGHEVQSVNISRFSHEKRDSLPTIISMAANRFLQLMFFYMGFNPMKNLFLNAWKEKWRKGNSMICKNLQQRTESKRWGSSGSCLNLTVNTLSNVHTLCMLSYCTLNCFRVAEYSWCIRRRMLISGQRAMKPGSRIHSTVTQLIYSRCAKLHNQPHKPAVMRLTSGPIGPRPANCWDLN